MKIVHRKLFEKIEKQKIKTGKQSKKRNLENMRKTFKVFLKVINNPFNVEVLILPILMAKIKSISTSIYLLIFDET